MSAQGEGAHESCRPEMTAMQDMPSSNRGDLEKKNTQSNSKLNLIQVHISTPNYCRWYSDPDLSQILNSQLSTRGQATVQLHDPKLPDRIINFNMTEKQFHPFRMVKLKALHTDLQHQLQNLIYLHDSACLRSSLFGSWTTLLWSYRYLLILWWSEGFILHLLQWNHDIEKKIIAKSIPLTSDFSLMSQFSSSTRYHFKV